MSADIQPTRFMESNALLALLGDDEDAARAALADALPGELATCAGAADALSELCWDLHASRRRSGVSE